MENNNILTYADVAEKYVSHLKGIKKREEKLKYNTVIKEIFSEIKDQVIEEQKIYSFLGIFYLRGVRIERNFNSLAVNWFESNKAKKKLIEEGKKPAKKTGVSPNGNPVFDDGERWMVFYTDDFYFDLEHGTFKKTRELYKFMLYWKFKRNVKFMKSINKAIEDNIIKITNFPIYNGSKNNFI